MDEAHTEPGRELAVRLRRRWRVVELAANAAGALVVLAFLRILHSEIGLHGSDEHVAAVAVFLVYLGLAMAVGRGWDDRQLRPLWDWLSEDRPADARERDLALREPLTCVATQATLWAGAALLFGAWMLTESHDGAVAVVLTIVLGGVMTVALTYLLLERLLRPVVARALASTTPEKPVGLGVPARLITAWALASGVPMLGVALLAIGALGGDFADPQSFAVVALVLVGVGLVAGAIAAVLSARSIAEPIAAVRTALGSVRAGDLDVRLAVDDASEVGLLQAGFNEMAAGLRERERLRDLFGRHVGEDVARMAFERGVGLGGEVREVAVLFVDLVGSTALASRRPPEQVVSLLNRFFAVVVDVVAAHGGWVNKFEGDAALCVFGAPTEQSDAAGRALAAGRAVAKRLRDEVPELRAGIGISAGPAVAGNIGAERRLEYTVVGDPVNEAARLCELAKEHPGRVLGSNAVLLRASPDEAARWSLGEQVALRGRSAPTRLATPARDQAEVPPRDVVT